MSRLISSELDRFVTALWLERGLSDNTCQAYQRDVQGLDRWLSEQRKSDALAASESDIQAYLGARLADGSSHRSISRLLSSLRSFISTSCERVILQRTRRSTLSDQNPLVRYPSRYRRPR